MEVQQVVQFTTRTPSMNTLEDLRNGVSSEENHKDTTTDNDIQDLDSKSIEIKSESSSSSSSDTCSKTNAEQVPLPQRNRKHRRKAKTENEDEQICMKADLNEKAEKNESPEEVVQVTETKSQAPSEDIVSVDWNYCNDYEEIQETEEVNNNCESKPANDEGTQVIYQKEFQSKSPITVLKKTCSYDSHDKQFDDDEELFSSDASYSSHNKHALDEDCQDNTIERPSKNKGLYVGMLDFTIHDYDIIKSFSKFGTISSFQRPHPAYCFLEYYEPYHLKKAAASTVVIKNRLLKIEFQKSNNLKHDSYRRKFAKRNIDYRLQDLRNQNEPCKVFITGLNFFTSNSDIATCLKKYGNILDIYRPNQRRSYASRYVTFTSPNGARRAADAREIYINNNIVKILIKSKVYRTGFSSEVLLGGVPPNVNEWRLMQALQEFGPVGKVIKGRRNRNNWIVRYRSEIGSRLADLTGFIRCHRKFITIRHMDH